MKGHHQLRPSTLTQWTLGDEHFDLADEFLVVAKRQSGFHTEFLRRRLQFRKPCDLTNAKCSICEVNEGRAPPKLQRIIQKRHSATRIDCPKCLPT